MSKCKHNGCNVHMSSGDYCHRHTPTICPLCNKPLNDLMNKDNEHGPSRCVISMDAYRALEDLLSKEKKRRRLSVE